MKINDINNKIENKIDSAQSVSDLKEVLKDLLDENIILRKQLNVILSNLDSDNITEIDFSVTRARKTSGTILKGYATQAWVTANFQPKA